MQAVSEGVIKGEMLSRADAQGERDRWMPMFQAQQEVSPAY